jgi:putative lysine transport system substrate-binding protein
MIVSRLLGLRLEFGNIIIDPVLPHSMDGLSASLDLLGHQVTFKYVIKEDSFNPKAIFVNGNALEFNYAENKYRKGGAVISAEEFLSKLNQQNNSVVISL